jgi:hypothetical protein
MTFPNNFQFNHQTKYKRNVNIHLNSPNLRTHAIAQNLKSLRKWLDRIFHNVETVYFSGIQSDIEKLLQKINERENLK